MGAVGRLASHEEVLADGLLPGVVACRTVPDGQTWCAHSLNDELQLFVFKDQLCLQAVVKALDNQVAHLSGY